MPWSEVHSHDSEAWLGWKVQYAYGGKHMHKHNHRYLWNVNIMSQWHTLDTKHKINEV